jgi:hypothetical protein
MGITLLLIFFATVLRPQTLPISYLWLLLILVRYRLSYAILVLMLGVALFTNSTIQNEFIRKISFDYLVAFKREASANVGFVAFRDVVIPTNFKELLLLGPFLVFRFLLAPFPWELSNLRFLFAYTDAVVIIAFFSILVVRIWRKQIWNWNIILYAFLYLSVFGIFEIAFSGAVRHRMPYIIAMSPFLINITVKNDLSKIGEYRAIANN